MSGTLLRKWNFGEYGTVLMARVCSIALASTGDDGPALILSHSDWDLARAETQAQPQTEILAGVDDIVTRCTAFCIRKLAMHAPVQAVRGGACVSKEFVLLGCQISFFFGFKFSLQYNILCLFYAPLTPLFSITYTVAGLLLTGLPGAGKTSIVRAVARTLQEDPRAYTCTLSHCPCPFRFPFTIPSYLILSSSFPTSSTIHSQTPTMLTWRGTPSSPLQHSSLSFATGSIKPRGTVHPSLCLTIWRSCLALSSRCALMYLILLSLSLTYPSQHVDSFRTRHITELFLALYASSARSAAPNARGVLLLATASSQAALHPLLSTAHVFEEVVNVRPPDKDARKHVRRTFLPVSVDR